MDYPSHSISPSTICETFTNQPPSFAPHTTSLAYRSLGAPVISYAMPLAVGRHDAPLFSMLKNNPMLLRAGQIRGKTPELSCTSILNNFNALYICINSSCRFWAVWLNILILKLGHVLHPCLFIIEGPLTPCILRRICTIELLPATTHQKGAINHSANVWMMWISWENPTMSLGKNRGKNIEKHKKNTENTMKTTSYPHISSFQNRPLSSAAMASRMRRRRSSRWSFGRA